MTDFWQDNLKIIQDKNPALHTQVINHPYQPVGELLDTPSGFPTLAFTLPNNSQDQASRLLAYNNHDPWQDAATHLSTVAPDCHGLALFIGMGLGYGALRVLQERPAIGMIVILEPNIDLFIMAMHAVDLSPLFLSPKTHLLIGETDFKQLGEIVQRIAALEDTHLLRHVPSFQWQENVYPALDRQTLLHINQFNAFGGTTRMAGERFMKNRMANLSQLRHSTDIAVLNNIFNGKPAVLVASGPSLDQSLDDLKKIVGHCVLFAVDAALAPLLKAGIMPDFVTTIDFHYVNFEKVAPFTAAPSPWPFSLITTVKGVPHIPKRLEARHRFWTFHDDRAEIWLHEALDIKQLIPPSASVAHLSLGCALLMGCDPIILVGQDLAYTSTTDSHARGSIIKGDGVPQGQDIFTVKGLDGNQVSSDRGLMCFQKVFEDIFAANPNRTFLNASAAGAHIAGAKPTPLSEITATLLSEQMPVQLTLDDAVNKGHAFPVNSFLKSCQQDLAVTNTLQKKFIEFKKMADSVRYEVGKLRKKRPNITEFGKLPPSLGEKLKVLDQKSNSLDAVQRFSNQVVELTFPALTDNDRQRVANQQILEKDGYLPWLTAEIDRIDAVNTEKQKACVQFTGLLKRLTHHLEEEETLSDKAKELSDADSLLNLVRLYIDAGDYQLAKEWLNKALRLPMIPAEAYILSGRIKAALLDFEGAEEAWQMAINLSPELAGTISQAKQSLASGWIDIAQRHGTPGSSREDDHPRLLPLWLQRAARLLEGEEQPPPLLHLVWQEHLSIMEQWLATGRHDIVDLVLNGWYVFRALYPEMLLLQARNSEAQGDRAAAITALEQAVQINPDQPQWLATLARYLLEESRFDEGLSFLKKAVSLDRKTASLWEELGDTLQEMNDPTGAISSFEQCFLALPERLDLLTKMGDCYLSAGQTEAAIASYQAVLARCPDDQAALHRLKKVSDLAEKIAELSS